MTPPKSSKSERRKAIREWMAIAVSVVAVVISFFAFKDVATANESSRRAEAERLLDEAWDLFGGGKEGATVISSLPTEAGTLERANRKIREALLKDSQNPRAFRCQATYFRAIGKLDQAAQTIQIAIRLARADRDERARDYITQGAILGDAGKLDAALQAFGKAKDIDPTNLLVFYDLAEVYHAKKRDQDSDLAYAEAIRLTAKTRGFAVPSAQNIPPSKRVDWTEHFFVGVPPSYGPSRHVT
jgi:tetratricopeptide (TPR) repeat protein